MIVERYDATCAHAWNAFVSDSRNGTFLFDRGYMDYHADRFDDHSLLLRDDKGGLLGILPANEKDGCLVSHGGLTYGGLVVPPKSGAVSALAAFEAIRDYLRAAGLSRLLYKTVPSIYHRQPAEEDRYALFRLDARLWRRDVLSVVPREHRLRFQDRRARGAKTALKAGVRVECSDDFAGFWAILEENLLQRHGAAPVHTLAEITLLRDRFPGHIHLHLALHEDRPVAGVVIYLSETVAHVQYISANDTGKQLHALDVLFDTLLNVTYRDVPYFDFGISNENEGRVLNQGLVEQKEGFGARSVCHDYYELDA